MRRQAICNIVNKLSENYADNCRAYGCTDKILSFDLKECYDLILNYCRATLTLHAVFTNEYKQKNGQLYINNKSIGRIALMYDTPNYKALVNNGIDYENKILAKQEKYFD